MMSEMTENDLMNIRTRVAGLTPSQFPSRYLLIVQNANKRRGRELF
jgi:hypothetical protein